MNHPNLELLYNIAKIYPTVNDMIDTILNQNIISCKSKQILYASVYYRIYLQTTNPNIKKICEQKINNLIGESL